MIDLKKEWRLFKNLRHLIDCNPIDKKLLKQELSNNYFQERLKSVADVRAHMSEREVEHFFGRSARLFFGTTKYKFSKKDMTITCINVHTRSNKESVYEILGEVNNLGNFYLTLRHV